LEKTRQELIEENNLLADALNLAANKLRKRENAFCNGLFYGLIYGMLVMAGAFGLLKYVLYLVGY
jgi:hypothetical protein